VVEALLWYPLISLAGASAALTAAVSTYLRAPERRALDLFVLAMAFFLAAAVFATLLRLSVEGVEALHYGRLFYFTHMLAVGYTAAFILEYFRPFRLLQHRHSSLFLQAALLMAAGMVASLVDEVEDEGAYGTVVESQLALRGLTLLSTLYLTMSLVVLARVIHRPGGDAGRGTQALLMASAVGIHGGAAALYSFLRASGSYPPPFLTASAAVMALLFSIAILHTRGSPWSPSTKLLSGRAYVLRSRDPLQALRVAAEARKEGRPVVCISRLSPERINEIAHLQEVPCIWLTSNRGENQVPPSDLNLLKKAIDAYLGRARGSLVVLQGVEYLAVYNRFNDLLRFLHGLQDAIASAGATLLVSLDPSSLGAGELAALERGMESLTLPEPYPFEVEDVFVISRGGLLLAHQSPKGGIAKDRDAVAGMLAAIQAFVREAVTDSAPLRRLEVGNRKVLIEGGREIYIAAVISGQETPGLVRELQSFIWKAENKFGDLIAVWDGSVEKLASLQSLTSRLVELSRSPTETVVGTGPRG
jgi:hypothetical protein